MNGNTRRVVFVAVAFAVVFGMATGFAAAQAQSFSAVQADDVQTLDGQTQDATIEIQLASGSTENVTYDFSELEDTTGADVTGASVNTPNADFALSNQNFDGTAQTYDFTVNNTNGTSSVTDNVTVTFNVDAAGASPNSGVVHQATANDAGSNVQLQFDVLGTTQFDVSNLDAPTAAVHGQNIDVTATITNNGTTSGSTTVQYNTTAGNNAGGPVDINVGSQTTGTLGPGNSTEVTFTVDTSTLDSADAGATVDYTHGIFTADDNETADLRVGSDSNGRVTVTVQDDALEPVNDTNVEILRSEDFTTVGAVNDADVLANGTPNDNGEIQFTGLAVGGNATNSEDYTVIAAREDPDFESSTSEAELYETSQTEDSVTITVDRLSTPEEFDITQSSDVAIADGTDEIEFNVSILGDLNQEPLTNEDFTVYHDGTGVGTPNGTVYNTGGNGYVTFNVSSVTPQAVEFEFVSNTDENVTATRTKTFVLAGEGEVAGTVYDATRSDSGVSDRAVEGVNVWAVQRTSFIANAISVPAPSVGNTSFYRLVDNETGEVLDVTNDYRIDNDGQNAALSISRVRELNTSDGAVGSGWAVETNSAATPMFVTPLEPGEYVLQRSDTAPNASDTRFTDQTNPQESFTNVSTNVVSSDLTLSAAQQLSNIANDDELNQNLWDTTDAQGDYVLSNLFTDYQNGVEYVVIANSPSYEIEFVDPLVTESGAFFEDGEDENYVLNPVDTEPNYVDVDQVGTHPPLSETGGAPDTNEITPFNDTSDDTYQEVSRDGTVDVIDVTTGIQDQGGQVTPTGANVTVDFNDEIGNATFGDAQFLDTALGGDVVSVGDQSITVNTGSDGNATVLFETDQSSTDVPTQKVATLETDTSVTDYSNVTFVGVSTYESASISGFVSDSEDTPLPGSPVWAQQITVEDPADPGQPDIVSISPDNTSNDNIAASDVDELSDEFDVELQTFNTTTGEYETINSDTATAEELGDYEFSAFPSISAQNEFKLFQFASEGDATYSLEPTPALAESGINPNTDYRIRSVRIEGNNTGVISNDALVSVQPDTTGTANVVIPITVDVPDDGNGDGGNGDNGSTDAPVDQDLWTAVGGDDGLELGELGSAISGYQDNGQVNGVDISLGELGSLINYYQNQ